MTGRDADGMALYSHVFDDKGRKITVKFKLDEPRSELAFPTEHESQLESSPRRHNEAQSTLGPQCEQQSESRAKPYVKQQPEKEEDALQLKSQSERQPEPLPEQVKCGSESTSSQVLPARNELQSPHTETQTKLGSQKCEEESKPQPVPSSEAQPGIKDALQLKLQSEAQPDPRYEQIRHAAKEAVKIESICDRLGDLVTYLEGLLEIGDVEKDVSHSSLKPDYRPIMNTHRSTRQRSLAFP